MTRVFVPSQSASDWRRLLAKQELRRMSRPALNYLAFDIRVGVKAYLINEFHGESR